MFISDLSRRCDVPVPTIKFYLREGLLEPGRLRRGRRADYDESHVSRIYLIRTLTVMGRMSISAAREALQAIDDQGLQVNGLCDVVNEALFGQGPGLDGTPDGSETALRVDRFVDGLGWAVAPDSAGRRTLVQVFSALERLAGQADVTALRPYADLAARLARLETDMLPRSIDSPAQAGEAMATAVLLEVALSSLRRMAREHMTTSTEGLPSG